jgi:SagB-type dehydrogenase family enzyme
VITGVLPTAQFSSIVHGEAGVALDDPAEVFHEASRLYPNLAAGRLEILLDLARGTELNETVARASRTHDHRPSVELPPPATLRDPFGELLAGRRSSCAEALRPVSLADLATLLSASYAAGARRRRPVPSAGALYPLEVYLVAAAVNGLERGVYHFNPLRFRLARLAAFSWPEVQAALVDPGLLDYASAVVVVTAVFTRSRIKYGQRGYRFALLEAGHLVQNAVLAATALGLPALPLGGFYDRRLDGVVGADGLDEAAVHALLLGGAS